jgi:hypothetical protein
METHVTARAVAGSGGRRIACDSEVAGLMAGREVALTCEEDEAEGEPHVPPRGFEHGREGCAEDAAEDVGAVGVFVLGEGSQSYAMDSGSQSSGSLGNVTGRFSVMSMSIVWETFFQCRASLGYGVG